MWNNDDVFIGDDKRQADLKALEAFEERAKEIEDKVSELRAVLAKDLSEFCTTNLRDYQYDGAINAALRDVLQTSGISEYDSRYDFWIPSNLDC